MRMRIQELKDFSLISQSVGAEGMRSGSSAKSIIRLSTSTGKEAHFSGAQTMFEWCMGWESKTTPEPTL